MEAQASQTALTDLAHLMMQYQKQVNKARIAAMRVANLSDPTTGHKASAREAEKERSRLSNLVTWQVHCAVNQGYTPRALAESLSPLSSKKLTDDTIRRYLRQFKRKPRNAPTPAFPPPPAPKSKQKLPEPLASTLADMQQKARRVNGETPYDSELRKDARRYAACIDALHADGVSLATIAESVGVTARSLQGVLTRHGFRGERASTRVDGLKKSQAVKEARQILTQVGWQR